MFETDEQTLSDLRIFAADGKSKSVFALFNNTASYGGRLLLKEFFLFPLDDAEKIFQRVECLKYIESQKINLTIDGEILDFIEHYLTISDIPVRFNRFTGLLRSCMAKIRPDNKYYIVQRAVQYLTTLLKDLYSFALSNTTEEFPLPLKIYSDKIKSVMESDLSAIIDHNGKKISSYNTEKFDHTFRYKNHNRVRELLEIVYNIDVFQAVTSAKKRYGLVFAEINALSGIKITGLYHPFIAKAVPNDVDLEKSNAVFITGANMSGKSTFMKAFGVAVYLAHMGFPVPAREMSFPVLDGLFTTINIQDNLSLGYSHFYSEVKRIKFLAEKIGTGGKYAIICDELFRGTNVKDAHESTVSVVKAFSELKNGYFLFSSHIIEAAEDLSRTVPFMLFKAFGTSLNSDNTLTYHYNIEDGISHDRFGKYIIEREGITELLRQIKNK